jgi:hypothetical protein
MTMKNLKPPQTYEALPDVVITKGIYKQKPLKIMKIILKKEMNSM